MLTELRISDFAVIDRPNIECAGGFLVFTGETGAGKSILVDALALLVGGRATADQIRAGAEEAVIEGGFALTPGPLTDRFREADFFGAFGHLLELLAQLVQPSRGRFGLGESLFNPPRHVATSRGQLDVRFGE